MKHKILFPLMLCLASPALAAEEKPMEKQESTVTVQGQSEVMVEPDLAVVSLGVVQSAPTAGSAQTRANQTMQTILDAIRQLGIPDKAIQTTRITLSPEYAARRTEAPVVSGYRASNTLSIRLEDLDLAGRVLDAATNVGGNEIQGIQFDLKDDTAARLQALREAVRSAHAKAEVMAEALGMKLGRVIEIAESNVQIRPVFQATRMMEQSSAAPVAPGQITVSAQVTLRCALEK